MFGFGKYQSGGQVDEYQRLEDYVRENKDYITNWVAQRPSVERTYDDLLTTVATRDIGLQSYPQDEWDEMVKKTFPGRTKAGHNVGAYYTNKQIHYPEGGEDSVPHEIMHYFAGHKPDGRGVPKINKYQEQDIKWKGWLPSLHPAGRRPKMPGYFPPGKWWNKNMATTETDYSNNPTGAPEGEETPYHPWYDEHAFDRVPGGSYRDE